MIKWIIPIGVIVVAVAAGGLYLNVKDGGEVGAPVETVTSEVPDLTFTDYEGREVRLSDLRGKALLVNAWAAWCPFCKEELKDFAAIRTEFGDRVVIVAVDRAEPPDTAKRFSDEFGVSGDLIFLLDPGDTFYRAIGGFSMPETIFVDRNGLIRFHKRGPMKQEEIRRRIEDLLISRE
jgi:thiol-disulfide isomerase/thioredoxin